MGNDYSQARRIRIRFRQPLDDHTRTDVAALMAKRAGLQLTFDVGPRAHSRKMRLIFADGEALIAFDQGFGFLKTSTPTPFGFKLGAGDQERKLFDEKYLAGVARIVVLCCDTGLKAMCNENGAIGADFGFKDQGA